MPARSGSRLHLHRVQSKERDDAVGDVAQLHRVRHRARELHQRGERRRRGARADAQRELDDIRAAAAELVVGRVDVQRRLKRVRTAYMGSTWSESRADIAFVPCVFLASSRAHRRVPIPLFAPGRHHESVGSTEARRWDRPDANNTLTTTSTHLWVLLSGMGTATLALGRGLSSTSMYGHQERR